MRAISASKVERFPRKRDAPFHIEGEIAVCLFPASLCLLLTSLQSCQECLVPREFEWVRGHQGHPLNERAHAISTSFAQGQPTELKQPGQAIQSTPDQAMYSPSREELRQWCAVAIASNDEPLTAEVMAKGKQLNALYSQETGSAEKPPLDYRHPALVISESDRQQMHQAIATAKQTLSAMAQPQAVPRATAELTH